MSNDQRKGQKAVIRDIMIPLSKYSVVPPDATLSEVVMNLRNAYCDPKRRFCNRVGPRVVFVVDDNGKLLGMLDLRSVLGTLIPETTGGLGEKLRLQAVSVAFAEAGSMSQDETRIGFKARVRKNATVSVREIMQPIPAALQTDSSIFEAVETFEHHDVAALPVYEGSRVVGVLRDRDLFMALTRILC